jgi:hypothetical protein
MRKVIRAIILCRSRAGVHTHLIYWTVKSYVVWDMDLTLFSPLIVNRRFGGTYRLKLQCSKLTQATKKTLLASLIFLTLKIEAIFFSVILYDFSELLGIMA